MSEVLHLTPRTNFTLQALPQQMIHPAILISYGCIVLDKVPRMTVRQSAMHHSFRRAGSSVALFTMTQ